MNFENIHTLNDLNKKMKLSEVEKGYWDSQSPKGLPLLVNSYWLSNIGEGDNDPFRLQAIPRDEENQISHQESSDPLGDRQYSVTKRAVHRYRDRLLLLVTQRCPMYCRHCFRRHFTGLSQDDISMEEIDATFSYLANHREIHELILSGGDSLMLHSDRWRYIIQRAEKLGRPLIIRAGTRLPVTAPHLFDFKWLELVNQYPHLWMMVQVNHPKEITEPVKQLFQSIRANGIPILNQSVLLRNINDSVETLKELSYSLLECGIKPYYIFQGDLAEGTSHFRVPLEKTYEIMKELRRSISGIAMPQFAVDLPGGGKIPLTEEYLMEKKENQYIYRNLEGRLYGYPLERNINES